MSDDAEDPPPKWPRGSEQEDFEVHRARNLDELAAWQQDQAHRPLTDALEAAGLTRRPSLASWGQYVVPSWWPQVLPPGSACPRCETPGGSEVCDGCADAQAAVPDPDVMIAWWEGLDPLARRLHLSAAHGVDPWSGRPVRISHEQAIIDDAGVGVSAARLHSQVPRTSWDLRDEA